MLDSKRKRVKVGDMGMAKALAGDYTTSGLDKSFTPIYVDPVFKRDGRFTAASDVYSLGLVLLMVFTGADHPAQARNDAESALADPEFLSFVAQVIPGVVPTEVLRSLL